MPDERPSMRALTVWQPRATLWAAQLKIHETRGWKPRKRPKYIAVHAASRWKDDQKLIANSDPFWGALQGLPGIQLEGKAAELAHDPTTIVDMPRGAIVGVIRLGVPVRTEQVRGQISDQEEAFGDFSDKRWAWPAVSGVLLSEPIPHRGFQYLWELPRVLELLVRAAVRKEVAHGS